MTKKINIQKTELNDKHEKLQEKSSSLSVSAALIKSMTNTIIPFESFNHNKKNDSSNINEKEKARTERTAFVEKIRNNSSVATTSEPDNTTLFSIFSCDFAKGLRTNNLYEKEKEKDDDHISFQDSIYFQHESTSCLLRLHEKKEINNDKKNNDRNFTDLNINTDFLVPEYCGDIPIQPSDPLESLASIYISINANACRLEEVNIEEIRDIMFACRFSTLLRTAISYVQHPNKHGQNSSVSGINTTLTQNNIEQFNSGPNSELTNNIVVPPNSGLNLFSDYSPWTVIYSIKILHMLFIDSSFRSLDLNSLASFEENNLVTTKLVPVVDPIANAGAAPFDTVGFTESCAHGVLERGLMQLGWFGE